MAVTTPVLQVSVNGTATAVLEAHTTHSTESPVAQASIVVPWPLPGNVESNASVEIVAGTVEQGTETIFKGRIRGPIDRSLSESDRGITVRCDGNLWRMALPHNQDLSWAGPVSARKVIRELLAFRGISSARVEQIVHPTTGDLLLLGGVSWFDSGRVVLAAGTSPLAMIERICRLFGYRVFDQPDGTVRVARICGPAPAPDFTLTEGVDWLGVSRSVDLHELVTYWEAQGATGTDAGGQEVSVLSRPVGGIPSQFIPNPPGYVRGTVSDQLLVTQTLANAARIAAEYDYAGVAWRVRGEIPGQPRYEPGVAPRWCFQAKAPSIGLENGKDWKFWLTTISRDVTESGYWTTVEGWRPTGKPAVSAPPLPPVPAPPLPDDQPWDDGYGDDWEDPVFDDPPPLPPTWPEDLYPEEPWNNPDGDPAPPDPLTDDPFYDPAIDPDFPTGVIPPPLEGTVDPCDNPPTTRKCGAEQVTEDSWVYSGTAAAPVELEFQVPQDGDRINVIGQLLGPGFIVRLFRNLTEIGSGTADDSLAAWNSFGVQIVADVYDGETLMLRFEETD